MEDAHTRTVEEVFEHFKVDEDSGLSDDQTKRGLEKYGPNGEIIFRETRFLFRTNYV